MSESHTPQVTDSNEASAKKREIKPAPKPVKHIVLTTHPRQFGVHPVPLEWGKRYEERGPIIATHANPGIRNVIGSHSGSYAIYRSLAIAAGKLDSNRRPDLHNTHPVWEFPPQPSWFDGKKIVSMDPWGAHVTKYFAEYFEKDYDIRPTIAITKAHINIPELKDAVKAGRIHHDEHVFPESGEIVVTKGAVDPVWYLPGVAERFGVDEFTLRRTIFEETNGMYPELITRSDLKVFLPPIGNTSIYIIGNPDYLQDETKELTFRIHDECNGSDVFGSDICTCRPYLTHAIEECIKTAQNGGVGLIIYFRKEGRALGEVTKYLVYNARKRQEGGDTAAEYFNRTECVAGAQDVRFQALMPDILHWMGIKRIHKLVSMSDMKYDAIVSSGIEVLTRVPIPEELIPKDAQVEMKAKVAAGYFSTTAVGKEQLQATKGRGLDE